MIGRSSAPQAENLHEFLVPRPQICFHSCDMRRKLGRLIGLRTSEQGFHRRFVLVLKARQALQGFFLVPRASQAFGKCDVCLQCSPFLREEVRLNWSSAIVRSLMIVALLSR